MEREKLNKAADSAVHDYDNPQFDSFDDYVNGFVSGAEWLMGQPLSEKLTEEEMAKIKERYDYYMSEEPNCYLGSRMRNEYELIFGKDLFKEK